MNANRHFALCPVFGCGWKLDVTPPGVSLPLIAPYGMTPAQHIYEYAKAENAAHDVTVEKHLKTHTVMEWLTTIEYHRALLASVRKTAQRFLPVPHTEITKESHDEAARQDPVSQGDVSTDDRTLGERTQGVGGRRIKLGEPHRADLVERWIAGPGALFDDDPGKPPSPSAETKPGDHWI